MHIERLGLLGFRNFQHVTDIHFPHDALSVVAAPNATGKTNFLESIVVLLRGRSWRATSEACTQWGQNGFMVEGILRRGGDIRNHLRVAYALSSKKIKIEENKAPTSVVAFYSHYPFVLFLPEDTLLFTRGPAQRRTFLNHVLVVVPQYLSALVQYQRALRQRNALLKHARTVEEVRIWTDILVEQALMLWKHRESVAVFLDNHLGDMYEQVSGERATLHIRLAAGTGRPDTFRQALLSLFDQERRAGYTLSGPHRDDLVIAVEGKPVYAVFSRGQMQSLVIALTLLAHAYMEHVTGEKPLLLLDDVLSELDEQRQRALLGHLPGGQLLLTCTTLPALLRERSDVHWLDVRSLIDSRFSRLRVHSTTAHAASLPITDETEEVVGV